MTRRVQNCAHPKQRDWGRGPKSDGKPKSEVSNISRIAKIRFWVRASVSWFWRFYTSFREILGRQACIAKFWAIFLNMDEIITIIFVEKFYFLTNSCVLFPQSKFCRYRCFFNRRYLRRQQTKLRFVFSVVSLIPILRQCGDTDFLMGACVLRFPVSLVWFISKMFRRKRLRGATTATTNTTTNKFHSRGFAARGSAPRRVVGWGKLAWGNNRKWKRTYVY